jgi:hypothetical protein
MMGYGNELSPYLGAPWVKTARHLLAGEVEDNKPHDKDGNTDGSDGHLFADWMEELAEESDELLDFGIADFLEDVVESGWSLLKRGQSKGKKHHKDKKHRKHKGDKKKKGKKPKDGDKLPEPRLPPNGTHTQLLHTFFTHRESPAFVATFLNLYNSTVNGMPAASVPPVLDHRPEPRQWRTSELVPFLGHIALERFSCGQSLDGSDDYVRAMVNGKFERMIGCEDGLEGSCKWPTFEKWVDDRLESYSSWDEVCTKKEE